MQTFLCKDTNNHAIKCIILLIKYWQSNVYHFFSKPYLVLTKILQPNVTGFWYPKRSVTYFLKNSVSKELWQSIPIYDPFGSKVTRIPFSMLNISPSYSDEIFVNALLAFT